MRVIMKLVRSGLRTVDEQLGGGFLRPSSSILLSDRPTEKRMFAENFLATGVKGHEPCIYIDFHRAPSLARLHFKKYGVPEESSLVIVDAASSQAMIPSSERYVIKDLTDMRDIRRVVRDAFEEERPKRVIVDSLEFLVDRFPHEEALKFWEYVNDLSTENNSVFFTLVTDWTLERRELALLKDGADAVLEFRTERMGSSLLNLVRVSEIRKVEIENSKWVPFKFEDLTGVVTYTPRILVIGSKDSGKEDFISSLCSRSIVDGEGHLSEGRDRRTIDVSDIETEVLGVPGKESFSATLRLFSREMSGVFLVLNSSSLKDIENGRRIVKSDFGRVPLVVIANRQQMDGAFSEDEIRRRMKLSVDVPIIEFDEHGDGKASEALQSLLKLPDDG